MSKQFTEEETRVANKQIKRCLTLLIIREMQNKVRNGYYLTPKDKIRDNIKLPGVWGKCNPYALLRGGKWGSPFEEQFGGISIPYHFIPQIPSCV